ncbi:MAG: HNH endonuclease [Candidatus Nanopelagicales bacterium]|nr:HNH endonuclease [Candidatus Nanopelagicales bacterium]
MPELPEDPFATVSAALADAQALGDQDLVDALTDAAHAIRALQATQAALITEVDARIRALGYRMSGTAETVAVTLAMSPRSAEHLTDLSVELCSRPVVWTGLAEGRIDATKAQRILVELREVPDPRREHLELLALDYATDHTPHQLRRYLLGLTCDHDPDATLRKKALDNRGVSITARGHGMADIAGYVSAEVAEAFMQALETLADSPDCADPYGQGDQRSKDQRRADALAGFLTTHCTYQITVDVIIPADTLIGDNDYGAASKRLGPLTSELARSLCFSPDARWRRLVTDPLTGRLVDMNATTYRIPERIRNAVKARDLTCRFPGCHRRAEYADCDHIIPWPTGKTRATDLAGMCRHHHRVKTHSAWKVTHDPTTSSHDLTWTSPLGTIHRTTAHNYHRRD